MASHYEGPHFDDISQQEYYQGYDAYGQPLGWYDDSNGQLLSQSLGHSAASFQDIDNATETQLPEQTAHPKFNQGFSDVFDPASNNGFSSTMISHYNPPICTNNPGYDLHPQHLLQQDLIPAGINAPSEAGMGAGEMQLPGQTVHHNFDQSSSDMFDPASNNECFTAPSTMISHYDPPIYTDDPGYQVQEQYPLQQNLIPAGITAHGEPGMDAGDMLQSGPQPMNCWYIDPSQSGYAPFMNSMSPQQNMPGTLFYPEPQAAEFPYLAGACGSLHHPAVPERADDVSL